MTESKCNYPIIWIDSALHNYPDLLKQDLQKRLDSLNCERVLMLFGYCGNALLGLRTGNYILIMPKVDDCITILLGSKEIRQEHTNFSNTYFITNGYYRRASNIFKEYEYAMIKYGYEKTYKIFKRLLDGYSRLGLIDTGTYNCKDLFHETTDVSKCLGLEQTIIPGTLVYIKQLLTGPYDDKFIVIERNGEVPFLL